MAKLSDTQKAINKLRDEMNHRAEVIALLESVRVEKPKRARKAPKLVEKAG